MADHCTVQADRRGHERRGSGRVRRRTAHPDHDPTRDHVFCPRLQRLHHHYLRRTGRRAHRGGFELRHLWECSQRGVRCGHQSDRGAASLENRSHGHSDLRRHPDGTACGGGAPSCSTTASNITVCTNVELDTGRTRRGRRTTRHRPGSLRSKRVISISLPDAIFLSRR